GVEAGGPPRHPERGAQCPAREAVAALRAVDELEALAEAAEDDRVVADGVAGAQAHDPDLIAWPLAHQALAREPPGALEVLAARPRHRAPERERRQLALLPAVEAGRPDHQARAALGGDAGVRQGRGGRRE